VPGFVEDRLARTVETGQQKEALAGLGRNPVGGLTLRRFGSEIEID